MDFETFSRINRTRCEGPTGFNHALESWSLSDWMTALVGEVGEAANIVKKLNRIRDGVPGNVGETKESLMAKLADELADVEIYLNLCFQRLGVNQERAVVDKFNRTSRKLGCDIFLGE